MIRIHGDTASMEGVAAKHLHDLIIKAWPWVVTDPQAQVDMVIGVKCHGQSTKDLDIVLLASFPTKARFVPFLHVLRHWDRQWVRPDAVRVETLCLVIEVKDSDPNDVRFVGGRAEVYYRKGPRPRWEDVSEQSHKQIFALKGYLESQRQDSPFVTNVIWLRNVDKDSIPARPNNFIGSNMTWELLLNVAGQVRAPDEDQDGWVMRAWAEQALRDREAVVRLLTLVIQPTRLDRVRMARVCETAVRADWLEALGQRQLILRGRGGTGKTMLLLQLAWKANKLRGDRVLILTYNTALRADLRRLLGLVGDTHEIGDDDIQVQTIMSFFASAFHKLGLLDQETDYLDNYAELKATALALVGKDDASGLVRERAKAFGWDLILIDEAQDWPEDERDLLRRFYEPGQFVIADGVDQFVRRQQPCDWRANLPKSTYRVEALTTCLRMKANLARFANAFAALIGLPGWNVDVHEQAVGGRVIVVEGDYFQSAALHARVLQLNAADGNQPVDMLACVPPSLVTKADDGPRSQPADQFRQLGQPVWDGVAPTVRESYPVSVQQLRVVQYDSCRGLEGWVVIAFGFDELYRYKLATWEPPAARHGELTDDPDAAARHAARWMMIPMSRAVDTLVVQIGPGESVVRDVLLSARTQCADFVEWVSINPS